MSKKQKTIVLKQRTCMDCGKTIDITLDKKTKKIISGDWYYGKHRFGIGEWGYSTYTTDPKTGKEIWKKCNPWYRELKFRLIDLKRTILHQYEDAEMWVCKECVLAEYGTTVQVKSRNPSQRYDERIRIPHFSKKDD